MARSHHIIVVGAGLFGQIAADYANRCGHTAVVIDSGELWGASKASGCVLAPSWMTSLSGEDVRTGMDILMNLYTVLETRFMTNVMASFKAARIDPNAILKKPDIIGRVTKVGDGVVEMEDGTKHKGKVLVAAGIGSFGLIEHFRPNHLPAMRALWGASTQWLGKMSEPRIHVYAPYRQAVAYQLSPTRVWMGDGTSLVEKTWMRESARRIESTVDRGRKLFDLQGNPKVFVGARPYVEGHKAGFFERVAPSTWVSTGGAKNGTILAAVQAHRFMQALP